MRILPSFTQLHVVPNLYALVSTVEHKRRYFYVFLFFLAHLLLLLRKKVSGFKTVKTIFNIHFVCVNWNNVILLYLFLFLFYP